VLLMGAQMLSAQDQQPGQGGRRGRNFDPAQMQERMLEGIKTRLGVTDDAEWTAMKPLLQEVMKNQQRGMGMMGFGGRGGRGGRGGPGGPGGQNDQGNQGAPGGPGGQFAQRMAQENPEMAALATTLRAENPSADEIKAKLAAYREAQKKRAEALKTARENLRKVLTLKQEAQLVLMGMLD